MLIFTGIIDVSGRIAAVDWPVRPLNSPSKAYNVTPISQRHEPVPRSARTDSQRRRGEARPHRHRHAVGIRPSDALQSGRRIPDADHEEAAAEIDRARAAVVSRRRYQHQISQGPWRFDLERMGQRQWRSRPGLRIAVAIVAGAGRAQHRPALPPNPYDT